MVIANMSMQLSAFLVLRYSVPSNVNLHFVIGNAAFAQLATARTVGQDE